MIGCRAKSFLFYFKKKKQKTDGGLTLKVLFTIYQASIVFDCNLVGHMNVLVMDGWMDV